MENKTIEWKKINGYENYSISSDGQVRNDVTGRLLKPDNFEKRSKIDLRLNGKSIKHKIHRLVYEHFIGAIPINLVVNHKDGNPFNNNIENLELISIRENINHGYLRISLTGYIGVTIEKNNYLAYIQFEDILHKKRFKDLQDAIDWRKSKEIEFGLTNLKYLTSNETNSL